MQVQQPHDDTSTIPAGHHGRLVYAQPRDLPSYPSIGLAPNASAASAAASLGWQSRKSPQIWTPDRSASASAAAVLAKDHKMATAWAPQPSEHGAQAALLAHKAAARSAENGKPSSTDHGYTAATSAFNADRTSRRSNPHATVPIDRQRSLVAAKGAMATPTATRRSRANTLPNRRQQESYPDESNAASNALKAAAAAHKPKASAPSKEAGATPFVQMNRQMFTSKPPVQAESDEQRREDALHASALTMAKKMFEQQQKVIDQTKKAQQNNTAPHTRRRRSSVSDDDEAPPMQFNSLQDAAYKAAQERLAKLDIEMQSRNYKDYYGQGQPQRKSSGVRGKLSRRRSSSDGDIHNDRERSQQIRQQMSIFNNKVSQVDQQKRQHDRDALLAAAQRNVTARLKGMDDKIARETGMMPPSTKASWESKAHATAQLRSDNRVSKQQNKVDIGAGKYMEQEEIDAIAANKVQPVIDEINERAEQEHARVTEQKLEEERQREERELERQRQQEVDDINKNLKEQMKQEAKERRLEEKAEAKARKEEEKAAKAEQKRLAKEEKRKSAAVSETAPVNVAQQDNISPIERVALNDAGQPVRVPTHPLAPAAATPESPTEATTTTTRAADDVEMPDASAIRKHRTKSSGSGGKSPTIRVRSWFQSHFHRGSKSDVEGENGSAKSKDKGKSKFIGGAALTGFGSPSQNGSTASINNRSSSVHAVAMAGRPQTEGAGAHHQSSSNASERGGHSPLTPSVSLPNPEAVSPMSSSSEDEFFHDVAPVISSTSATGGGLSPPRPLGDPASRKSHSPNRDSRFHEII